VFQFITDCVVPFTLCQDCASSDMQDSLSRERMSCHCLHCSCLSLWKPASFNMFGLRVQNNTNGLSEIWRNFQGGRVSVSPINSTAQPQPSETLPCFWCCINHNGWLRWSHGGQEGHTLALQGKPVQDVTFWFFSFYPGWTSSKRFFHSLEIIAINTRRSSNYTEKTETLTIIQCIMSTNVT